MRAARCISRYWSARWRRTVTSSAALWSERLAASPSGSVSADRYLRSIDKRSPCWSPRSSPLTRCRSPRCRRSSARRGSGRRGTVKGVRPACRVVRRALRVVVMGADRAGIGQRRTALRSQANSRRQSHLTAQRLSGHELMITARTWPAIASDQARRQIERQQADAPGAGQRRHQGSEARPARQLNFRDRAS
jgi:hypothetical protein